MQYYGTTLCVTADELCSGEAPLMSRSNLNYLLSQGKIEVAYVGRGRGDKSLMAVDSLPEKYRKAVESMYNQEKKEAVMNNVYDRYWKYDGAAAPYFAGYLSPAGHPLGADKIKELADNASAASSLIRFIAGMGLARSASGEVQVEWTDVLKASNYYRDRYGHTLPDTKSRLREKIQAYRKGGYDSLLGGRYGNVNSKKVDDKVGRLLLQLVARSNNPFVEQVYEDYNAFVCGELDIIDPNTGEIFDNNDYRDSQGEPLMLSKRTIDTFLNRPANKVLIQAARESWISFYHNHMPHLHRKRPEYSLSKVTFDDRDLPRKERNTKQRPKAYYAYDVCSGVCLGAAYSRTKDINLVEEMFRDFFRNLRKLGVGLPMQVEVENHLMSQWRDGFLQAGKVFPFVRFCAPQNSQEKSAEHYNRGKKVQVEHRYQDGIGRFYSKLDAYVVERKKQSDQFNNTYEEKAYYSWDELINDDREVIERWNNLPHHNQKKYPGMSKMQVFMNNLNPELTELQPHLLAKYIGEKRSTSIRRNDYCRVNYTDWHISSPAILEKLESKYVDAYWLPEADGSMPEEIYIYQGDKYIDTLKPIEAFQEAIGERTSEDWHMMHEQLKRRSEFVDYIKENAITPAYVQEATERVRLERAREDVEEVEVIYDEEIESTPAMLEDDVVARMAVGDL